MPSLSTWLKIRDVQVSAWTWLARLDVRSHIYTLQSEAIYVHFLYIFSSEAPGSDHMLYLQATTAGLTSYRR